MIKIFISLFFLFEVCKAQKDPVKIIIPGADCKNIETIDQQKPLPTTAKNVHVDRVIISKKKRKTYLLSHGSVVRSYASSFGNGYADGPKIKEGDGRTPEGRYEISFKNAQSAFHKALKISYPNAEDIAFARLHNLKPGGDIMLHGLSNDLGTGAHLKLARMLRYTNWTQGCVALMNDEIDEVFDLVEVGTIVDICPTR